MSEVQQDEQSQEAQPADAPQAGLDVALMPGQMRLDVSGGGMRILIAPPPIPLGLGEDVMSNIVRDWLASHPALADELLQQRLAALRAQKEHLKLVEHVKRSKIN